MALGYLIIPVLAGLLIPPLLGGLTAGVDRRLTARFQSRKGPPLFQPFYDVLKLLGKERSDASFLQPFCAFMYLSCAAAAMVLFFLQADLLLIFFVHAAGAIFFVVGAYRPDSPYSRIGASRELLQMLAYEPVLILVLAGIGLKAGTFGLGSVYMLQEPLLPSLPLVFIALTLVLTVKLRKSPFDHAASHHAHQEIVRGVYTEYSGPSLALTEIAHWYEVVLLLLLATLFWAVDIRGMLLLIAGAYLLEIIVDNISARLNRRRLFILVLGGGIVLCLLNILWLQTREMLL